MKIELDEDAITGVVRAVLEEHIKYAKRSIKELKAKQKTTQLKDFELQDLGAHVSTLESLKNVHAYFGGNL
jgi:hypothetical protein